jgi:hypothetical protein
MTGLKSYLLLMVLTLGFVPALGAEPDEANAPLTELKFEITSKEMAWRRGRDQRGVGPIRPTHVAKFFVSGNYSYPDLARTDGIRQLSDTSAGRSVSARQREFLVTSDGLAVERGFGEHVRNHRHFRIYAVSPEDAKRTVQAFIELMTKEANSRMQEEKNQLREGEEKIAEAEQRLTEAEAKLEAITVEYQGVKRTAHPLSSDEEAAKQAKETILEMGKILDTLGIEIAGIEAKLSAIEKYKSKKSVSIEALAKLEQILSEQTIELVGAMARKEAALEIRKREQEFYKLAREWMSLEAEVKGLRKSLPDWKEWCREREAELANPDPHLLPPKLYRNRVTIHPVNLRARL